MTSAYVPRHAKPAEPIEPAEDDQDTEPIVWADPDHAYRASYAEGDT